MRRIASGSTSLRPPPFLLALAFVRCRLHARGQLARPGLGFHGDTTLRIAHRAPDSIARRGRPPRALDVDALERSLAARALPCTSPNGVVALVVLAGPGRTAEGVEETVAALVADFVERDRLERALGTAHARVARDERLTQLGRVACSAAHDFNNVLTAILGYADLLELELADAVAARRGAAVADGAPGRAELEEIRTAAARGATLVEDVLGFGRRRPESPSEVDLADTIRCLEGLLRRVAGDRVLLDVSLAAGLPAIRIDVERLERVVMNLVANARQAIEARADAVRPGGRIEIGLDRVDDPSVAGAATLRLVVRDDGCGMSRAVARRALEPFFTTRAAHGGTGLGLADAAELARGSGGRIAIESAQGRGTEVALLLPAAGASLSSARRERSVAVDPPAA
ncbi:MAG: ATP-binding protein [Myxococcota bacterium]